ncbi:Hypothetical protein, putative [Bodo saltans]|uniref:Uncharacterized protein n=1 Tax=Bodo saltans TaxID=75058 RepID=A0A0S4IU75_BODSA|nr:Hypothetical protein, putative [Bodo saltans]|eukprot:CUG09235.1 Hypothetical protein, putative [Bodo saltans]
MGALQDPSTTATTNRTRSRPGIVFESDMGVANFDSSSSSSSSAAGSSDDDDDADDLMTDKNQLLAQTWSQVVESPTSTPQRKQSLRRISSNAAAAGVFQLPPLVDILIIADVKRNSVFGQAASKGAATAPSALIPSPSMMSQKLALPPIAMSPARNNTAASPFGNGSIVNFVVNVDIGGGGGVDDIISPVGGGGGGLDTSGNTPPFSLISPLAKKTSSVVQSSMYRRSPPQRSFTSGGGTPPRQVSPTTSPVDDIVRNVVQQHVFIRLGEHQQQQPQKGGGGGDGFVSFAGVVELTSFASTSLEDNATFSSSVHGGNKSQAGLQRRLSKRFLTFSNLLDAADRAALFEGTPQDPTDSTSLEQSLSPRGGLGATVGGSHSTIGGVGIGGTALMPATSNNNDVASSFRKSSGSFLSAGSLLSPQQQQQQRRGSSSFHQLPQQPSFRGTGATSPIREGGEEDNNKTSHATSPSSGVKKRFATRYGTSTATSPVSPLSKGSEAHTFYHSLEVAGDSAQSRNAA